MNRRELLGAGVGAAAIVLGRRAWAGPARRATAPCELGPFYKRDAPGVATLRGRHAPGLPLALGGTVYDTRGDVVQDATIELWHADAAGLYDIDGNGYRTKLALADATYKVDTVMPGHYPGRVCQHVHYVVRAPGHKPLVTQLYFATDPALGGEPAKNFTRDPLITSVELVRPVMLGGDGDHPVANVTFDLVLERA